MKSQATLSLAVCLLALTGCASPPFPLERSYDAHAARVRVIDNTGSSIELYPEGDCNDGYTLVVTDPLSKPFKDAESRRPTNSNMLGSEGLASGRVAEFSIRPNQRVNLGAMCLSPGSFIAREGIQYEVEIALRDVASCNAKFSVLEMKNGRTVRTPLRGVQPTVCKTPF